MRDYLKRYNRENRERIASQKRAKRATWTPERREAMKQYYRDRAYRNKYGIGLVQALAILKEQGGCGICGGDITSDRMEVDHCHQTGGVRGILCGRCNTALGFLGDNIQGLQRAIQYLTAFQAKTQTLSEIAKS